jgi:hypothetical protein
MKDRINLAHSHRSLRQQRSRREHLAGTEDYLFAIATRPRAGGAEATLSCDRQTEQLAHNGPL